MGTGGGSTTRVYEGGGSVGGNFISCECGLVCVVKGAGIGLGGEEMKVTKLVARCSKEPKSDSGGVVVGTVWGLQTYCQERGKIIEIESICCRVNNTGGRYEDNTRRFGSWCDVS